MIGLIYEQNNIRCSWKSSLFFKVMFIHSLTSNQQICINTAFVYCYLWELLICTDNFFLRYANIKYSYERWELSIALKNRFRIIKYLHKVSRVYFFCLFWCKKYIALCNLQYLIKKLFLKDLFQCKRREILWLISGLKSSQFTNFSVGS